MLRKLGFVDAKGAVTLKGRAACEVDTAGVWNRGVGGLWVEWSVGGVVESRQWRQRRRLARGI